MAIVRYTPRRELARFEDADRLFDRFWRHWPSPAWFWTRPLIEEDLVPAVDLKEEDGRFVGPQRPSLLVADFTSSPHSVQRGQHHRQRPVGAMFPLAEQLNCPGVGGIDEQLESAQTLQRDDPTCQQGIDRHGQGLRTAGRFAAVAVQQP